MFAAGPVPRARELQVSKDAKAAEDHGGAVPEHEGQRLGEEQHPNEERESRAAPAPAAEQAGHEVDGEHVLGEAVLVEERIAEVAATAIT
eukprot:4970945-Alexandrium_andersonii.AAC.1